MPEMSGPIAQLNTLIRGINVAVLTTVRSDGSLWATSGCWTT